MLPEMGITVRLIHPDKGEDIKAAITDDELTEAGVTADMVRLSVGFEDVADIIEDLDQALKA